MIIIKNENRYNIMKNSQFPESRNNTKYVYSQQQGQKHRKQKLMKLRKMDKHIFG